jgi:phosphinothricin acetyltransferase
MILRAATPADAAALSVLYAPYVADSVVSFETEPPDSAEMRRRIEGGGDLYPWLLAEEGGEVLGYAYASAFRPRAAYRFAVETTVYCRQPGKRSGIGTRLYRTLLAIVRDQGFTEAIGAISLPNPASVGLHEKLGFRQVGTYVRVGFKLGEWHDVGLWQCALAAPADPPAEPRRLAEIGWPDAYRE